MTSFWRRITIAGAMAVAAALVGSVIFAGLVLADSGSDTPSSTATAVASPSPSATPSSASSLVDDFLQKLAGNLNLPEQQVRDGISKTLQDEVSQALQSGNLPFGLSGSGGAGSQLFGALDDLAAFLKVDRQQLLSDLAGGQSLAQIAATQGQSRQALKDFLSSEAQKQLNQAVQDGKLTQDQADNALQKLNGHLNTIIDLQSPFPFNLSALGGGSP
jgi:hypothetical protein